MHQRLSLPWLLGIFYSGGDTGGTGPMGGARVFCAIFYDFFFAAHVDRWRDELKNLRDEFARDVALMRERRSIMRERPEKGVMRPALFLLWLVLHMYALIVLSAYGAYHNGPTIAWWWFVSTGCSGVMYLMLMYSDPGFVDGDTLKRLTENVKLGVDVVGSDAGRGLIHDAAGAIPAIDEMLPVADPDQAGAGATGASSSSDADPNAEDAQRDLLRPSYEEREAHKTAEKLAHAKAYWEQRPQDWSDSLMGSDLPTPNGNSESVGSEGGANARAAAATTSCTRGAKNGDAASATPSQERASAAAYAARAVANADEIEVEMGEVRNVAGSSSGADIEEGGGVGGVGGNGTRTANGTGPKGQSKKGRVQVMPTGDGAGRAEEEDNEEDDEAELAAALARNPRIVGYDERGGAEAAEEARRAAEERRNAPLGIHDFFSGYCDEADMYLPIRAKYVKKHGRIISKFDHYCYMLGNSVGELNHGRFWRLLAMQVFSIWTGEWLLSHAYLSLFKSTVLWTVSNIPLIIMNIITWFTGLSLSFLLVSHTFMCLTSSTTYEFIKLEKLEYLQGFYQFSYPFSEGLCENVRHFCCPRAIKLWRRAPPESEWPETFWRNRYYSCCS